MVSPDGENAKTLDMYFEDGENKEKLIKFLSYGFASEEAVKNLICIMEEDKDTTLMAYAIDALKYYDLNNEFDI